MPFNPWRAGVGTPFPEVNPALKVFKDPINGETLLAIPALNFDIAFLHAAVSDPYGNVHIGTSYGDRAIYAAADQTYVQVEQIVSNEEIRKDPLKTAIPGADGVIRARFGAHPHSSRGITSRTGAHQALCAGGDCVGEGKRFRPARKVSG